MTKPRYSLFDTHRRKWLSSCVVDDTGKKIIGVAWTLNREYAMRFPGVKSAKGMARRLEAEYGGRLVISNARGGVV